MIRNQIPFDQLRITADETGEPAQWQIIGFLPLSYVGRKHFIIISDREVFIRVMKEGGLKPDNLSEILMNIPSNRWADFGITAVSPEDLPQNLKDNLLFLFETNEADRSGKQIERK